MSEPYGDLAARYLATGADPEAVTDATLSQAVAPIDELCRLARDIEPESVGRLVDLFERAVRRPTLSAPERARLQLTAVALLARRGETTRALALFDHSPPLLRGYTHLIRNAASWLAARLDDRHAARRLELLGVALGGTLESLSVGGYRRCWEAARSMGEAATPMLERHRESIAEAWVYARLIARTGKIKGHADRLLSAERTDDKLAAALLLCRISPAPSGIVELTRRWIAHAATQGVGVASPLLGELDAPALAGGSPPAPLLRFDQADELLARHKYDEAEPLLVELSGSADPATRFRAIALRSERLRITSSQRQAWDLIDAACTEAEAVADLDPSILSLLQQKRAYLASNTLRLWDAVTSARRSVCLAASTGNAALLERMLRTEETIAKALGTHRLDFIRHSLDGIETDGGARTYETRARGEAMKLSDDWLTFTRKLESDGLTLYAAERYASALGEMLKKGSQHRLELHGLGRDQASARAETLATQLGADRLLLDIYESRASARLDDRARKALLELLARWTASTAEIPVERERGGPADRARTIAGLLCARSDELDRRLHRDAWTAVQLAKSTAFEDSDDE